MNVDDQIAVMLAYKAGKKIQYREKGSSYKWIDCDDPQWNFQYTEYRIKPANPEVILLTKFRSRNNYYWSNFLKDINFRGRLAVRENVKYIQVTPEVEAILTKGGINCNESDS